MSWWRRVLGFEQPEKRDVQFSPELSAMLANAGVGQLSGAGVAVNQDTAMRFMAVYACVRVIAEDVASLPLPVYRRLKPRGKERAPNYPLYRMLHDQANEEQTSMAYRETALSHQLLWGNSYSLSTMFNGRIVEVWPIMPYRVSIRRNRETQRKEYIITPPGGEERRLLNEGEVFHVPGLSLNGVTGLAPIQVMRDAIGGGLAGQEFGSAFFRQGGRPSGTITHPGQLSEEAHKRVRDDFNEMHTGLSNAQRWALLEEGMKAETLIGMPLEDAQFIEQRKFAVEEIARGFRVQPHKIGHHERSTFNNIEHLGIDHVVSTIRPWLVRWEQAIRKDLIPPEEQEEFFAEFVVDGLLRGDADARSKYYKAMREIGVFSANDVLEKENMNPVEGGDIRYVPANWMEMGAEPESVAPLPAKTPSNGRKPAPVGA